MPEAGLTPTRQESLAVATVLDGRAPAAVWRDLADALEPAIRGAVRELLAREGPTHHSARADVLREAGVSAETTAEAHAIASILAGYDRAPETAEYEAASTLLREYGQPGAAPLGWGVPLSGVGDGPLALLEAADVTPTVAIRLKDAGLEQRADQRRAIFRLVAELSQVVDVRLIATYRRQRILAERHRSALPGVSEWCNSPRGAGSVAETVDRALRALDPDGPQVALLRALEAEPGQTLAYADLYAEAGDVGESRVRQRIGRLRELDLVATYAASGERLAELLRPGTTLLERLDAEVGRQQSVGDCVSDPGQSARQAVLPGEHEEGETGAGEEGAGSAAAAVTGVPYRTAFLDRPAHAAAAGTAVSGTVTLATGGFKDGWEPPGHVLGVSYEGGRGEAVVSVPASGPMQYIVSCARALASSRLLERIPDSRLEGIEEPRAILRSARNIGGLTEAAVEDAACLRDRLAEWREELVDMTRRLSREEYDDRARFRGEIMRSAHGLAGSVVHLLDAAGIDVVRELRIPAGLNAEHQVALARTVALSAAIQSRYEGFAAYRQLFEARETKREEAFSVEVDAAAPFGEVIGSYVVRGPAVDRFRPALERALAAPAELHEEAPEFAIRVPVGEVGREATASAVSRILGRKQLRPSRAAVSILDGLTASPEAAARACHQLGDARYRREVRPDELRYALGTLEGEALLPDVAPTAGKLVTALLRAEGRLSRSALADRAGVSARSIRRHQERLEALGLVETDAAGGWRLRLSFRTAEERRGEGVLPAPVATECAFAGVVSDVVAALLGPEEYAAPGGEVYERLSWPAEPWALLEDPRLEGWIEVAAALVGECRPAEPTVVSMGPRLEQVPLGTAGPTADAPSI